jgi:Protein of unknown function (DUF4232)
LAAVGSHVASDAPRCRAVDFRVSLGPRVSEATGQHTLILQLRNSGSACTFDGYPQLSFVDASGSIPFVVRHVGDMMITARPPRSFVVRRRGVAYPAVNKYRCDVGPVRTPTALQLGSLAVSLARTPRELAWCGHGDPGSVVDVTPFEPTMAATRRHA